MSDRSLDAARVVARDIHTAPHTIPELTSTQHVGESPSHTSRHDSSYTPAGQSDATFAHSRTTNDSSTTATPTRTPPPTRSNDSSHCINNTAYAHNHAPLPTINHHPPLSHRLSGTPALAGLTIQTDLGTSAGTNLEKQQNTDTPPRRDYTTPWPRLSCAVCLQEALRCGQASRLLACQHRCRLAQHIRPCPRPTSLPCPTSPHCPALS
jgi:hypothetical protein